MSLDPTKPREDHALYERVVLIDDEPNIRETAAFILDAEGIDVETAADGVEGLEAVRRLRRTNRTPLRTNNPHAVRGKPMSHCSRSF